MKKRIRFNEIELEVPEKPGIYEIYTNSGIALKVGIGVNLRKRLLEHQASLQARLKLKEGGDRTNPNHVKSKESILAKHLYYDQTITEDYDLTTEQGRQLFLSQGCYLIFQVTTTKEQARKMEKLRENEGSFRYVGRVSLR